MRKIQVGNSYEVLIGEGTVNELPALVENRKSLLVSDFRVGALHGATVSKLLGTDIVVIPDGERSKCLAAAGTLWKAFAQRELCRGESVVIALGGGVVGDLAGFAASTYMRGIGIIHVPTTLLACADSSVGGKTGVDFLKVKNLLGTFHQPEAVIVDTDFLKTLPSSELRNGMAEVVKHGVIGDAKLFRMLERGKYGLEELIGRSVGVKAKIVEKDERENGERRILNFGHTIGHAIELQNGGIGHGEAVSVGMVTEARIAERLGMFHEVERLEKLLISLKLPVEASFEENELFRAMKLDKKGRSVFALPERIGKVSVVGDVPEKVVKEAIT
jgi:3-dehydroquinate synthase